MSTSKKIIFLAVALLWLAVLPASAQTREIIFNWKSDSFAPYFYEGKVLPSNGSKINMGLEVTENGKLADLTRREIRWFVNGKLLDKGVGLKKTGFTAKSGGAATIRIEIKGLAGGDLEGMFVIPVVEPEIAVELPEPDNSLTAGVSVIKAWPFFFNVKSLKDIIFSWTAGGQKTAGNTASPNILELELPPESQGNDIAVSVSAQNRLNLLEVIKKTISLLIK